MKYYISEYWSMMNSSDESVRKEGHEKWDKSVAEYTEHYKEIRKKLPKGFIKIYDKYNFHDFEIIDINVHNDLSRKLNASLLIYDYYKDYGSNNYFEIIYYDVKQCNYRVVNASQKLGWGYDEFEIKEGLWIHRILCNSGTELEIVFSRIGVRKVTKQLHPRSR